jgi:predicted helicase
MGVRGLVPLDVAIFDEAHRTAVRQGDLFAHSLRDENIRIRKRLFFTATPRKYDIRHRDKKGDFRIVSMDDKAIYGPRAYTLTFIRHRNSDWLVRTDAASSVVALFRLAQIALPPRVRHTSPPKRQSRHKRRGRPRRSATST